MTLAQKKGKKRRKKEEKEEKGRGVWRREHLLALARQNESMEDSAHQPLFLERIPAGPCPSDQRFKIMK